jgi:hypothetical protein
LSWRYFGGWLADLAAAFVLWVVVSAVATLVLPSYSTNGVQALIVAALFVATVGTSVVLLRRKRQR